MEIRTLLTSLIVATMSTVSAAQTVKSDKAFYVYGPKKTGILVKSVGDRVFYSHCDWTKGPLDCSQPIGSSNGYSINTIDERLDSVAKYNETINVPGLVLATSGLAAMFALALKGEPTQALGIGGAAIFVTGGLYAMTDTSAGQLQNISGRINNPAYEGAYVPDPHPHREALINYDRPNFETIDNIEMQLSDELSQIAPD